MTGRRRRFPVLRSGTILAASCLAAALACLSQLCSSASGFLAGPPGPRPAGRALQVRDASGHPGQNDEGWMMMPLGVPKVAYRIPGAPNAEWVDIYNRLYRERIVFLGKEIDDKISNEIIGVLLYLDSEDNNKPIYLYINSAGGSVIAGLAIYDTMMHIKSPVITINVGMAASMASFLLASGEKGKRIALPHSRVMIHQAMGGAQGQAEDIKVEAQQILQIHDSIIRMYARVTGKAEDVIREDLMRDNFMSAQEAKEYGLVDQVIQLNGTELPGRDAPGDVPAEQKSAEPAPAPAPSAGDEPDTKEV